MTKLKRTLQKIFSGARKSFSDKMGDLRTERVLRPALTNLIADPMRQEARRLDTFRSDTLGTSETEKKIASKGFYYLPNIKTVQCFACGQRFDYPLGFPVRTLEDRHREASPQCPFLCDASKAGDIPIPIVTPEARSVSMTEARVLGSGSQDVIEENGNGSNSPSSAFEQRLISVFGNDGRNTHTRFAPDYELMKSELERLKTFTGPPAWPISFIRPSDCARAGFFYVGDGDKVQCAFCRGVAGEWENGDVPAMEHRRHFPRCPFICGYSVGNIGLSDFVEAGALQQQPMLPRGVDVCGRLSAETLGDVRLLPDANAPHGVQPFQGTMEDVAANLQIRPFLGPSNQAFVTLPARLKTFRKWPESIGQDVQAMAEAGFYYTGSGDQVKCFYCNGGLKNWVAGDEPWAEHAKWFPFCTHVVLNKGDDYVRAVEAAQESLPSSQSNPSSDDDEEVAVNVENMEVEKSTSPKPSSSGISSGSRGNSPISDTVSSGHCSGDEGSEKAPSTSSASSSNTQATNSSDNELENRLICKICMDNDVGIAFLPCGHLVSCTSCATSHPNCALCRQPIRGIVRVFQS